MKLGKLQLNEDDILSIQHFKNSEHRSLNELNRANILLLLHKGKKESDITDFLDIERTMIWKTKQKYLRTGIEGALKDAPRSGQPRKYSQAHETELVATACSKAPDGRERWTLELLTEEMKKKPGCETMNRETVRLTLKKMNVSLG